MDKKEKDSKGRGTEKRKLPKRKKERLQNPKTQILWDENRSEYLAEERGLEEAFEELLFLSPLTLATSKGLFLYHQ